MHTCSSSDLKALRLWLAEPQAPAAMKAVCDRVRSGTAPEFFFGKGGLSFIREAMVAADFALARGASLVRLVPEVERRPDFELAFPGRTERFELVEADRNGRRRGQEYERLAREPAGHVRHIGAPSQEETIVIVRTAAHRKAKPYPVGTCLLIYLNLPRFLSDVHLLASFPDAVAEARPFFDAIWVTWQGIAHRIDTAT